jgi:hypothetical protein
MTVFYIFVGLLRDFSVQRLKFATDGTGTA